MKRSLIALIALAAFEGSSFAQDEDIEIEVKSTQTATVATATAAAVVTAPVTTPDVAPEPEPTDIPKGLSLSGYIQVELQHSAISEDELLQGGSVVNRDRFLIRRGRVRVDGDWKYYEARFELDGSTTRGASFSVRRAFVGVKWPSEPREPGAEAGAEKSPPLIRAIAGLTEIPFGYELRASQRDQMFMERTNGSLAFFPGPTDVGLRVDGALGPFVYDLAVMNGVPVDDRAGGTGIQDPTAAPDFAARFGVASRLGALELSGGASFLFGTGFHPGSDATKNRVEWRDLNEDGTIDVGETVGIPGSAASPSATFEHWAVGADLSVALHTALGLTHVFGEATIASNLDRGAFGADPIESGSNIREVAAYAAVVQDLYDLGIAGVRYDFYDPSSDLLEQRRGLTVPRDASIHTISLLAGVRLPRSLVAGVAARLMFQYDIIFDALARDASGIPGDLKNDQFTIRIQGEL